MRRVGNTAEKDCGDDRERRERARRAKERTTKWPSCHRGLHPAERWICTEAAAACDAALRSPNALRYLCVRRPDVLPDRGEAGRASLSSELEVLRRQGGPFAAAHLLNTGTASHLLARAVSIPRPATCVYGACLHAHANIALATGVGTARKGRGVADRCLDPWQPRTVWHAEKMASIGA